MKRKITGKGHIFNHKTSRAMHENQFVLNMSTISLF